MRAISIEKAKPGMIVGKNIYNANGSVLLSQKAILTERYIDRLKSLGIMALYITSEYCDNLVFEDVISEKTRNETMAITRKSLKALKSSEKLHVRKVTDIIDRIIDEIIGSKDLLSSLIDIRALNDYLFSHSVNVAVLSLMTGLHLGIQQQKLRYLGMGSLFHDMGKIAFDNLYKNQDEFIEFEEQVKKHTEYGFEMLRKTEGVSLLVAHIAFQHHEHFDGSGYPRGLAGEEISLLARVVAVASSYDNLTSDTPAKPRILPQHATEYLTVKSGTVFDPEVVKAFISNIALFPIGTLVLLNSGERGIVIKSHKEFPTRPLVKVVKDHLGQRVNPPFDIDLMKSPTSFLERVLEEEEI
ncbi:MAG: HD-GYP domain-containing protein [Firmicutes bacterium HGW-Firmicutes-8]|nr:MAG: HD-GYP domain-containing protein [Firmicutes bacterium HGW-Firmicutes-8]